MSAICRIFLPALCCLLSIPLFSTDKWIEVRSPGSARRAAREFEQMRAIFASQFPTYRLDSGAPLIVLAPKDEGSFKVLVPPYWKGKGVMPVVYFQHEQTVIEDGIFRYLLVARGPLPRGRPV